MSHAVVRRYLPNGEVRAIWNDHPVLRAEGYIPRRASRIEVIESGPKAGLFCVDFSLLADAMHDEEYRVCLATPFTTYIEANFEEVKWLSKHWLFKEYAHGQNDEGLVLQKAKEKEVPGQLEIDHDVEVSIGCDQTNAPVGAWVRCWVFVHDPTVLLQAPTVPTVAKPDKKLLAVYGIASPASPTEREE